jgi:hypothetical protein
VSTASLHRHARGDFRPVHGFQTYNDRALRQGGDITSAYLDPRSARFFLVVATAQPRRTVVMRPEEYGPPHPAAAVDVPRSEDLFHAT